MEHKDPAQAMRLYTRVIEHSSDRTPRFLADALVSRGDLKLALKDPQAAFEDYERATQLNPQNARAHLRAANLLLVGNSPDRAGQEAGIVFRLEPGNADALAIMGIAALAQDRVQEAMPILQRVLDLRPERGDVAIIVADLYRAQGRDEEAHTLLLQTAEKSPKDARLRVSLARMAEEQGDNAAAEQNYRLAIASDNSAETNLRLAQFLQRTSRLKESADVLAHIDAIRGSNTSEVADYKLNAGNATQAGEQYRSALAKLTNSLGTTEPSAEIKQQYAALAARIIEADLQSASATPDHIFPARLHLQQFATFFDPTTAQILGAEIALVEGDTTSALAQARSAVALSSESAAAHYLLAAASARGGDVATAKSETDAAVSKDPGFIPARLQAAEQALADGNPDAAEIHAAFVVRSEPANLRGLLLYARILAAQKRYLPAIMMARRALAVDASSAEAHCIQGAIDAETHNVASALIEYQQAVVLAPASQEAIEGLVNVYRFGQITRPMLLRMERVASNPPSSATLMETAGRLFAQNGWYSDAQRCLRAAADIDPQRSAALTALARSYLDSGNTEAAQRAIAEANRSWAELLEGDQALRRDDVQSATRSFESALHHGENSGVTANNLAWIYAQRSINLDRALELAQFAHQTLPRDLGVMDTLGYVYLQRREYNQAIVILENALGYQRAQHIDDAPVAELRQHLAEAYRKAGRTSDAEALSR
ncbi:MAG: tetratricopeptide repeat protein [Terriglobales bacterium]